MAPNKKKEIESMTKDCMKKGPMLPFKESICKKGAERAYKKMKKMEKENSKPSIFKTITNRKKPKLKF